MSNLGRQLIDALLPQGSLWRPVTGGGFDKFLNGVGQCYEDARVWAGKLAVLRDPWLTDRISDLELEYGLYDGAALTESDRRQRLANRMFPIQGNRATRQDLQDALQAAGFNLQVYDNNPAINPKPFIEPTFQMVAGGGNAYAGRPDAYAGNFGGILIGELVVNGDLNVFLHNHWTVCAGGGVYAGGGATAGEYDRIITGPVVFPVPAHPDDWPCVFFVAASAGFDESTGAIVSLLPLEVPAEREQELKRLILRYKPLDTWAVLIVAYV